MRLHFVYFLLLVGCAGCVGSPLQLFDWSSSLDNFITNVRTDTECAFCKSVVWLFKELIDSGWGEVDIEKVANKVCVVAKVETKRVCNAIVVEFKDELFYVLQNAALDSEATCAFLMGSNCGSVPLGPDQNWSIPLPPFPKEPIPPPKWPVNVDKTLRVLFLSDIHVDTKYSAYSNADCNEPLCCRSNDGPIAGQSAGKWGDLRNCDIPMRTAVNLFEHLSSLQNEFDYIIMAGDLPPHNVWNQTRHDQLKVIDYVIDLFHKYLPHLPVFPSVGNHESAPVNSFPPPWVKGNLSESWLYSSMAKNWGQWLPKDTLSTVLKGGFYQVPIRPGLRLVSLNTNFCNNQNWFLLINSTDPAGMLKWFVDVLSEAERIGEKVHVIGHVFPGTDDCLKAWSWMYYRIVNRFSNTIAAQFFGHTHDEFFEMFYDEETFTNPINVLHLGPSVTTYTGKNPGYRLFTIDASEKNSTFLVLQTDTYFMNVTEANITDTPHWRHEYSLPRDYNMTTLMPDQWNELIYRMRDDDGLFQLYQKHKSRGGTQVTCTGKCKTAELCSLKTARSHDTGVICSDLGPSVHLHRKLLTKHRVFDC